MKTMRSVIALFYVVSAVATGLAFLLIYLAAVGIGNLVEVIL